MLVDYSRISQIMIIMGTIAGFTTIRIEIYSKVLSFVDFGVYVKNF